MCLHENKKFMTIVKIRFVSSKYSPNFKHSQNIVCNKYLKLTNSSANDLMLALDLFPDDFIHCITSDHIDYSHLFRDLAQSEKNNKIKQNKIM